MHKQPGYILFMTFSILALCAALVSAFMIKGITHKKLTTILLEREQLQQLALSTPALAQSFLSFSAEDLKVTAGEKKAAGIPKLAGGPPEQKDGFEKMLLEKVLPVVNITQKFNLKEIDKGLPLVVSLTFFAESGKININGLYDLVSKKFYNEGTIEQQQKSDAPSSVKDQKVFATWLFDKIAVITEKPSLMSAFVEHVKQRKIPFNDVTELLAIKEFADCFSQTVFYEHQQHGQKGENKGKKLFLTDLFTVASENDTIQPWLLSPSVCALLDITAPEDRSQDFQQKEEKNVDISFFKPQADWTKDWDTGLKRLYGISYDKLPEQFRGTLASQFSAKVFSMIATVSYDNSDEGNAQSIRVFALLKEKKLPDSSIVYDVIKVYQI